MSLFIPGSGRQKPICVNLSTTNLTAIVTGTAAGILTIESLWISCGTATTLSVSLTDGITTWPIFNGETLTANDHDEIKDHHWQIFDGWSLKAQAGAVDRVTIVAVVSLSTQSDNARR